VRRGEGGSKAGEGCRDKGVVGDGTGVLEVWLQGASSGGVHRGEFGVLEMWYWVAW
jgi:hypothetical protein